MKIFHPILLIGLLFITACEKDNAPLALKVENVGMPLIVKEIFSDDLFNVFTYNEQNLPLEYKSKFFYTLYHYNANNQVTSYDMYEDPGIYSNTWVIAEAAWNRKDWVTPQNTEISGKANFKYQDDNLKSITVSRTNSDIHNTSDFTFDENGRIVQQVFSSNGEVNGRKVYTYDNFGNVILEGQYFSEVLISTKSFEYDNKHNPFRVFRMMGNPGIYTNENNIVKETLWLRDSVPGIDSLQVTESTYEYNDQGYPVKKDNLIIYEYK